MSEVNTVKELEEQAKLLREHSITPQEWLLFHLNSTVTNKFSLKDWVKDNGKSKRSG